MNKGQIQRNSIQRCAAILAILFVMSAVALTAPTPIQADVTDGGEVVGPGYIPPLPAPTPPPEPNDPVSVDFRPSDATTRDVTLQTVVAVGDIIPVSVFINSFNSRYFDRYLNTWVYGSGLATLTIDAVGDGICASDGQQITYYAVGTCEIHYTAHAASMRVLNAYAPQTLHQAVYLRGDATIETSVYKPNDQLRAPADPIQVGDRIVVHATVPSGVVSECRIQVTTFGLSTKRIDSSVGGSAVEVRACDVDFIVPSNGYGIGLYGYPNLIITLTVTTCGAESAVEQSMLDESVRMYCPRDDTYQRYSFSSFGTYSLSGNTGTQVRYAQPWSERFDTAWGNRRLVNTGVIRTFDGEICTSAEAEANRMCTNLISWNAVDKYPGYVPFTFNTLWTPPIETDTKNCRFTLEIAISGGREYSRESVSFARQASACGQPTLRLPGPITAAALEDTETYNRIDLRMSSSYNLSNEECVVWHEGLPCRWPVRHGENFSELVSPASSTTSFLVSGGWAGVYPASYAQAHYVYIGNEWEASFSISGGAAESCALEFQGGNDEVISVIGAIAGGICAVEMSASDVETLLANSNGAYDVVVHFQGWDRADAYYGGSLAGIPEPGAPTVEAPAEQVDGTTILTALADGAAQTLQISQPASPQLMVGVTSVMSPEVAQRGACSASAAAEDALGGEDLASLTAKCTIAPGTYNFSIRQVDRLGRVTTASAQITFTNVRPTMIQAPKSSVESFGSPQVGAEVGYLPSIWEGRPFPLVNYQWYRCLKDGSTVYSVPRAGGCRAIRGATASTYQATVADAGFFLRRYERAANSEGYVSITPPSAGRVIRTIGAPVVQRAPKISGNTTAGGILTVSTGAWRNISTVQMQWFSCRLPVPSVVTGLPWGCDYAASGPTYILSSADQGKWLIARVIARNLRGTAVAYTRSAAAIKP